MEREVAEGCNDRGWKSGRVQQEGLAGCNVEEMARYSAERSRCNCAAGKWMEGWKSGRIQCGIGGMGRKVQRESGWKGGKMQERENGTSGEG